MTEGKPSRSRPTPAANGSKWIQPSTRWAIYYRDDFACIYCGRIPVRLTIDHVKDVGRGGTNDFSNLVACCLSCNSSKRDLSIRQWFRYLRKRGYDTEQIRGRLRRSRKRLLDRDRGRFLASTREKHGEGYENGTHKVQPLPEPSERRDSCG